VGRALGRPVDWERLAALGPHHRGDIEQLETALAADVCDDDDWNAEAWARVEKCLASLGL